MKISQTIVLIGRQELYHFITLVLPFGIRVPLWKPKNGIPGRV